MFSLRRPCQHAQPGGSVEPVTVVDRINASPQAPLPWQPTRRLPGSRACLVLHRERPMWTSASMLSLMGSLGLVLLVSALKWLG
jgi:hypothetical protein